MIFVPPPDQIPPSLFDRGEPNIRPGENSGDCAWARDPSSTLLLPAKPLVTPNPKPNGVT